MPSMAPWAHPSQPQNDNSIGSTVFAALINVTNRQADRPTDRPIVPFALLSSLVLRASAARAEHHGDAAAVDEVARHVDDDEDDDEDDHRDADDRRHAQRQHRAGASTVCVGHCRQTDRSSMFTPGG